MKIQERNVTQKKKQPIQCVQFATPPKITQNYPQSLALLSAFGSIPDVTFGA